VEPATGTFDVAEYSSELGGERNRQIATRVLLSNERVRIWELRLAPGERAPFHWHTTTYFFVCVDAGRARSRFPNGTMIDIDYEVGAAWFSTPTEDEPDVHDLENVGRTTVRFTTVELLDG
jgi:hypothetical protein